MNRQEELHKKLVFSRKSLKQWSEFTSNVVANFSKFESGIMFACFIISLDPTMVGAEWEKFEFQGL